MVDLANITQNLTSTLPVSSRDIIYGLSAAEAVDVLLPAMLFIIGMVIYGIFIFKFYRFIARKDIFELDLQKYAQVRFGVLRKFVSTLFYLIKYIVLFPLFSFFWFLIFNLLLMFLSKEQTIGSIMLVSIAIVSAVRITAYYDEDLSKDLAKMLPFALLGIFLVDIKYFSFSNSWAIAMQIPSMWKTMLYYLVFVMALELILRTASVILRPVLPKHDTDEGADRDDKPDKREGRKGRK